MVDVAFAAAETILCVSHDFIQNALSVAQAFRALQRKEKGAFANLSTAVFKSGPGTGDTCWKFPPEKEAFPLKFDRGGEWRREVCICIVGIFL